jgi:hypothetical protein
MMKPAARGHHIKAVDVTKIVEVAKIVGSAEIFANVEDGCSGAASRADEGALDLESWT